MTYLEVDVLVQLLDLFSFFLGQNIIHHAVQPRVRLGVLDLPLLLVIEHYRDLLDAVVFDVQRLGV